MRAAPRGASAWPSERFAQFGAHRFSRSRAVIERLQRSEDFERVLRTSVRARSTHFAAHHLGALPSVPNRARKASTLADSAKLSTDLLTAGDQTVDDLPLRARQGASTGAVPQVLWWGAVVPKRHARRSVTRSLLKRQIRAAVARQGGALPPGLWVIRLRAPFDPKAFPSAASDALRGAAHAELAQLLDNAARGPRGR